MVKKDRQQECFFSVFLACIRDWNLHSRRFRKVSRGIETSITAGYDHDYHCTCLQKVDNAVMSSAELCHLCWCSQACINPIFHDTCGLGDICRYVAFFLILIGHVGLARKVGTAAAAACMHGKRYGNTADTNRNLGPG